MRQRRALLNRPWEEDLLHWAKDGTLHGHVPPPIDGHRHSTTNDGWCPGWAVEVQRQYLSASSDPGTTLDADREEPGLS